MPIAHLADRGIVKVSGEEARKFLDGLVTCDIDRVGPGAPQFGGLLTPQGKILFDFIVFEGPPEIGGGYLLDCARAFAADLVQRLAFYKLRAKLAIEDRSEHLAVIAGWDVPPPSDEVGLVAVDPRLPDLGWRAIVAAEDVGEFVDSSGEDYHAHRIGLGVPEGGKDFLFREVFPHEALMDQLHGVDFGKGCYVGQEIVSRMQHRGTARTRIVPVIYPEGFAPETGALVTAGERTIGASGSGAQGHGLVMIRLDRAQDAIDAGIPIRSGGHLFRFARPSWLGFPLPGREGDA